MAMALALTSTSRNLTTFSLSLRYYNKQTYTYTYTYTSSSFATKINLNIMQMQMQLSRENSSSNASSAPASFQQNSSSSIFRVPALEFNQMEAIADQAFHNYTYSSHPDRTRKDGTVIVWFRNDLRILDNEVLFQAWRSSQHLLPVYCIDPRLFATTHYFGFPKTGALRAQFLMECLADLRKNLIERGLNLLIQHGKPEHIIPYLANTFGAHTVYAQKETCSEELHIETLVSKALHQIQLSSYNQHPQLQLLWGTTVYHIDDLPFNITSLPDVYTQFRKAVESKCSIRSCIRMPNSLGSPPKVEDWGSIPNLDQLGLNEHQVGKGLKFFGGETAALSRVHEYFWNQDLLKSYKEMRNGMLGADYSTKFSPWLAAGCLSPRYIYEEVKRYENERLANNSTYWVLFELIWRDYFRFLSVKYGNSLFHLGGPRKMERKWSQDEELFDCWRDGRTGYPLIDANMKELSTTGFMSNRGRQIVCSFLVRDMGIDWRMGAEWFEACLLDYDPCSNYGNWTYGAGVGNDPREDRYFSIPKQAQTYDPEGEYVTFWLPQLRRLPKEKRHFPGMSYIPQVVPLKFGKMTSTSNSSTRQRHRNFGGRQVPAHRRQRE